MENRLIQAVLELGGDHREQAFSRIVQLLQRVTPVRRGRMAPSHKGKKSNKYSQNRLRPF